MRLQSPEHIVDGIIVKINRAGPRPEYEAALRKVNTLPPVLLLLQSPRLVAVIYLHFVCCFVSWLRVGSVSRVRLTTTPFSNMPQ